MVVSHDVFSESTTTLTLPEGASLSFDAPEIAKLKEVSESGRYQYLASSADGAEQLFSLSVYVDPIDCHFGESTREVTRCFLEKSDLIPGIIKDSRSTRCDEDRRCEVIYFTAIKVGESIVSQLHANTIFTYRGGWVDVHISVINPTGDYAKLMARFAGSLNFVQ
jgi:hypothetical protein